MGRIKKTKLTFAQIEYRNSLLKGKVDSVKAAEKIPDLKPALTNDEEIGKCFYYLNNCVYWVNQYIDGRVNKQRLLETARAMQENARKLELLLK